MPLKSGSPVRKKMRASNPIIAKDAKPDMVMIGEVKEDAEIEWEEALDLEIEIPPII
jgi:hypothetical protein